MIELLHTEVDVVPGRKPQLKTMPRGNVGTGSAVLTITNDTDRQNDYTIEVKSETVYWQPAWYKLIAVPSKDPAENENQTVRIQKNGQIASVRIASGKSRDIVIAFFAPLRPDSRAGVYQIKVRVKTEVTDFEGGTRKQERFTERDGTIVIRPYYRWTVTYEHEQRIVKLFRRRTEFNLQIKSTGNDWLYCDLKLPKLANAFLNCEVTRVAVPPPDAANPGAESMRTVALRTMTKLRTIRGAETTTPINVAVQRIDAPSVPALADDPLSGVGNMDLHAPVLALETTEMGANTAPALVYRPPIPPTLTGFLQAIVQNLKLIVGAVIALTIAWQLAAFAYETLFHEMANITISSPTLSKDGGFDIVVSGKGLEGAEAVVTDKEGKLGAKTYELKTSVGTATQLNEHPRFSFTVPAKDANDAGGTMYFKFRRAKSAVKLFPPLLGLISPQPGEADEASFPGITGPVAQPEVQALGSATPGKPYTLTVTGHLGQSPTVTFPNTDPAPQDVVASDSQVTFTVPAGFAGSQIGVVIASPTQAYKPVPVTVLVSQAAGATGSTSGGGTGANPASPTANKASDALTEIAQGEPAANVEGTIQDPVVKDVVTKLASAQELLKGGVPSDASAKSALQGQLDAALSAAVSAAGADPDLKKLALSKAADMMQQVDPARADDYRTGNI